MDITYISRKLEKIFNSDKELSREYGAARAHKIKLRMAVLHEAKNLQMVPTTKPERRHKLSGDRDGQWSVDLDGNWRLCFKPMTDQKLNEVPLNEFTAIRILDVCDPH